MERENNYVKISGKVLGEFVFDHECKNTKFYTTTVQIARLNSNNIDEIPIIAPENLVKTGIHNTIVEITGEYRSFNQLGEDGKTHLKLFLYVKEINYEGTEDSENFIYLEGFIVKPPKLRETPLGSVITDLHLAVNRTYNKTDYIPCIAWNKNAWYTSELKVGDKIQISGRIQSRDYIKRYSEFCEELKTAYEVSIYQVR